MAEKDDTGTRGWLAIPLPENREDLLVKPSARLVTEVGARREGQEGGCAAVTRSIDGDERDAEGLACDRGGILGVRVEVFAVVASSVQAYDQRLVLWSVGRVSWYTREASDNTAVWELVLEGLHD